MTTNSRFFKRNCPACGDLAENAKCDTESQPTAETMSYEDLVPVWNGFFKDKVFFSYARCKKCELLYAPIFLAPKDLENLYAQMPANMDVVPIKALRKTQAGYFDVLKAHAPLKGDYIEIGPDIGLFTENCVAQGNFDHYWLFEPNRDVTGGLTKTMQSRPHQIIHEMFGFSAIPDGTASAAVMVHVLDHLIEPVTTLNEMRQKMMPDARLLIVTHDESSLLRRVFKKRWPAFCLQHPQIYSPKSMRNVLDAAGFEVVKIQKTVNHFPLQFLVKHLLWALGLRLNQIPTFGGLTLGLKLGNMITVAKPKVS